MAADSCEEIADMPESSQPSWLSPLAWSGVILVASTAAYWARGMLQVRISPNITPVRVALLFGAALSLLPFVLAGGGLLLRIACGVAITIVALFMGLDSIATLPSPVPSVGVGSPAPDFTARTSEGDDFSLSSLRGRPVLLKFFRGHW